MGCTYRTVPPSGAASGLHLFVSPGRLTTAVKVGTYVPRCTASFSRTLEFFYVLLTVHLSIFVLPLHVSST